MVNKLRYNYCFTQNKHNSSQHICCIIEYVHQPVNTYILAPSGSTYCAKVTYSKAQPKKAVVLPYPRLAYGKPILIDVSLCFCNHSAGRKQASDVFLPPFFHENANTHRSTPAASTDPGKMVFGKFVSGFMTYGSTWPGPLPARCSYWTNRQPGGRHRHTPSHRRWLWQCGCTVTTTRTAYMCACWRNIGKGLWIYEQTAIDREVVVVVVCNNLDCFHRLMVVAEANIWKTAKLSIISRKGVE